MIHENEITLAFQILEIVRILLKFHIKDFGLEREMMGKESFNFGTVKELICYGHIGGQDTIFTFGIGDRTNTLPKVVGVFGLDRERLPKFRDLI